MTQTGKAVALISSFGAVGGVGAYAGGLFSNKEYESKVIKSTPLIATVSDRLTDEGFLVLDTSKDGGWQEVLNAYNDAGTKKNLFSEPKAQIQTIKELQQKCAEIINKQKDKTNNYSLAKQWCVKKEKISDVIDRAKLKLLKFDAEEHADEKPHWVKKLGELKKDKQKFSAIASSIQEGETTDIETSNIKAIKGGCTNLKTDTLETTSEDFPKNLELAKEWCSIDK